MGEAYSKKRGGGYKVGDLPNDQTPPPPVLDRRLGPVVVVIPLLHDADDEVPEKYHGRRPAHAQQRRVEERAFLNGPVEMERRHEQHTYEDEDDLGPVSHPWPAAARSRTPVTLHLKDCGDCLATPVGRVLDYSATDSVA